VRLLSALLLVLALDVIQISQHGLDRPHETFLDNARFALFNCDEMTDECHTNVGTNTSKNVPPAVKLKNEAPGKANIMLDGCDVAAKMEVDAPEEVPKEKAR
jgi:hypothetical protein